MFVCSSDVPDPSLITLTVPASHLSHSHVATPVCALLLKISKPHFHHQPTSPAFRHAQTPKAAKDLSSLMCFTPSIPFSDPQTQSPCGTNSLCNLIPIFSTYLTPPVRPPNRRQLAQFTLYTLYTSHCHSLYTSLSCSPILVAYSSQSQRLHDIASIISLLHLRESSSSSIARHCRYHLFASCLL